MAAGGTTVPRTALQLEHVIAQITNASGSLPCPRDSVSRVVNDVIVWLQLGHFMISLLNSDDLEFEIAPLVSQDATR
jgi:hypothetical protein